MRTSDDMTRFGSALVAVVSVVVLTAPSSSARPRYGGTLRVAKPGVLRSLDPLFAPASSIAAAAARQFLLFMFETLIGVDADGGLRPVLANSWEVQGSRVRIRLR